MRLNCELKHVNVVLSPDPNVFRHSNPLAGLEGGRRVRDAERHRARGVLAARCPATARHEIRRAEDPRVRPRRVQDRGERGVGRRAPLPHAGCGVHGRVLRHVAAAARRRSSSESALFDGIRAQLTKKFGAKGGHVVEDNLRVIRRGFDELREVEAAGGSSEAATSRRRGARDAARCWTWPKAQQGIGNPGRFWEQVCVDVQAGPGRDRRSVRRDQRDPGRDERGARHDRRAHGGAASSSPRSAPDARSAGRSVPTRRSRGS